MSRQRENCPVPKRPFAGKSGHNGVDTEILTTVLLLARVIGENVMKLCFWIIFCNIFLLVRELR